jgi:hypothetical protein
VKIRHFAINFDTKIWFGAYQTKRVETAWAFEMGGLFEVLHDSKQNSLRFFPKGLTARRKEYDVELSQSSSASWASKP